MIIEKRGNPSRSRSIQTFAIYGCSALTICFVVGFLIWSLRDLILPSVLGVLLAYLFRPAIRSPRLAFLPYNIRVLSALVTVSMFFFGIFYFVQRNMPDERGKLELKVRLQYKINERYSKIMGMKPDNSEGNFLHSMFGREIDPLKNSLNYMISLSKDETEKFMSFYQGQERRDEMASRYLKYFQINKTHNIEMRNPSSVESETNKESTLSKALHLASVWVLLPIIFLFLLFDDRHIVRYMVGLVPNRYFELTLTMIHEVDLAIGNYLRGTFLESVLVSIAFSIGLIVIGFPVKAAFLIGMFAGITNAIPLLGPLIGLVVSLIYALIAEDITPLLPGFGPDAVFFGVVIVVVVTHLMDNVIFAPIVLGGAVNLHPLVVILGVMGGSISFGFTGMLLAIPTIVVVKVMTETLFRGLKAYRII